MTNDIRFPTRRPRRKRWWECVEPADFFVAWAICTVMVSAGYLLTRRQCRR